MGGLVELHRAPVFRRSRRVGTVAHHVDVGVGDSDVLHREDFVEDACYETCQFLPLLLAGGEVGEGLEEPAHVGVLHGVVVEPHSAVGAVVRQHGLDGLLVRLVLHDGVVPLENLPVSDDAVLGLDDLGVRTHEVSFRVQLASVIYIISLYLNIVNVAERHMV